MDDKKTVTRLDALLKEAQALAQVTEAAKREAAIWAEIARLGGGSLPAGMSLPNADKPASDIAKLPLTDAVLEDLRTAKKPKTPQQIWQTLEAAGYEANSDKPEESVKWALKKLVMRGHPDIVHIGWNTWHLRSKYKKGSLERLINRRAGKGGRTTDEHVARTLEGMQKAKARGKLGHRPSRVTAEIATKLKQAMLSGGTQKAIAEAGGISVSMFNYYKPKLEVWHIGEAWPPAGKSADDQREPRLLKLVKS